MNRIQQQTNERNVPEVDGDAPERLGVDLLLLLEGHGDSGRQHLDQELVRLLLLHLQLVRLLGQVEGEHLDSHRRVPDQEHQECHKKKISNDFVLT